MKCLMLVQELPAAQATQMLAMLRTQPAGPYAALQQLAQVGYRQTPSVADAIIRSKAAVCMWACPRPCLISRSQDLVGSNNQSHR